ncbi:MAG: glycosyltransferase family 39 protein [Myxococcota bacterium]
MAAGVRAFAWSKTAVLFNDGPIFLAMAAALREGGIERVLDHPQHPLYPALIAALESLALPPETAAVCVSIGGGLLAVAAVFRLAWSRFGPDCAWVSAWTVALHPWAVDFSADVMSDGLYMGLYLAGLTALVALLERPRAGAAVAFGCFTGLAYWTRPEGLALGAVAALVGFARVLRRDGAGTDGRALLRLGVLALAVVALLVFGLRVAEWRAGGDVGLSQKKSVRALLEGGPSAEALARDRAARRARREDPAALPLPESSARAQPDADGERPARSPLGLVAALARVLATGVSAIRHEVVLFALIGCWLVRRGRAPPRPGNAYDAVVAVSLAVHVAMLVLLVWGAGYVSRRHALAPGLALVPLAAWAALAGLERGCAWARPWLCGRPIGDGARSERAGAGAGAGRRAMRTIRIGLVVLLVLAWGPRDGRARRVDRLAERRAAEWLGASGRALPPIAAQKRRTAYYADAAFVPLPDGRDGRIEEQLRRRHAGYVIIDRAKLADHRGLAEGVGRWLVPIHVEQADRQAILVLAIEPAPAH